MSKGMQETQQSAEASMRRLERFILPVAIIGAVAMIPAALYFMHIMRPVLTMDGKLKYAEAIYWTSHERMKGKTLAECQECLEVPIVPEEGFTDGSRAIAEVSDQPGVRVRVYLADGLATKAEVVPRAKPADKR